MLKTGMARTRPARGERRDRVLVAEHRKDVGYPRIAIIGAFLEILLQGCGWDIVLMNHLGDQGKQVRPSHPNHFQCDIPAQVV